MLLICDAHEKKFGRKKKVFFSMFISAKRKYIYRIQKDITKTPAEKNLLYILLIHLHINYKKVLPLKNTFLRFSHFDTFPKA